MRRNNAWIVSGLLAICVAAATAQDTESVNAQNRFNIAGTIYNRTGTLPPLFALRYIVPVPQNYSNPDILLTLNATSGDTGLNIYCNPGYGQYADVNGNLPGPGSAEWFSDLSTPVNQIFISKNDPYYKSPTANETTQPSFICLVLNSDATTTTNFTLVANIIAANRTLVASEQTILGTLYSRCCSTSGACNSWKAQNSGRVNANGGNVYTDFCTFPNQICSPTGNLYRLNLDAFNLSCVWPGDLFSQFRQLSTLTLNSNPSLQGNTTAVSQTLLNLTSLQFVDLSGDTAIKGSLDSGVANDNICSAVKGNLVSLNLNGIGLSGGIPGCLYSQGSGLTAINLGANNFTGTLQNVVPVNSSLQLLHVDFNQLTGELPASLSNAKNLVDLDTTMNRMTGTIPSGIGAIKTLSSFVIKMNNHTGPIPDSFGTALNLQQFDVKQNSLTAFPAAWLNSSYNAINSSYVNIRASMNAIQGPFPAGLWNAQQLTYLIVNQNNISGALPSITNMFANLRALNVSFNQLNGTIPAAWGRSAIFSTTPIILSTGGVLQQVFDLSYNKFTGNIPSFLSLQSVPSYTRGGIYLQGNSLNASCMNTSYNYIASLCPTGNSSVGSTQAPTAAAASPAVPPPQPVAMATPVATPPAATILQVPTPPAAVRPAATSPAVVSTQSSEQQKSGGGGLSGGAIAGIVIGVLAGVALAVLVAFLLMRRRRGGTKLTPQLNGGTFSMPSFAGDGEVGRKSSLKKGLTSLSSNHSGFERFEDQHNVELSANNK